MGEATKCAWNARGNQFGLRPGDRDELQVGPLYGEAPAPIPLVPEVAPAVAQEPELPAAPPPPAVRDFAGSYARADLRRYAACLGMDGWDLGEITLLITLDGQPVTEAQLERILLEREATPAPALSDPLPPPPATWPAGPARDLAAQLQRAMRIEGLIGAPRLRDLARSLDAALEGAGA